MVKKKLMHFAAAKCWLTTAEVKGCAGRSNVCQRVWVHAATWQGAARRTDSEILERSDQHRANATNCVPQKRE